jgi:uncharacterized protein involved in copper resistance
VATNVSTPQADTKCPSADMKYSNLRYKKQEKFAPYIPIDKARGFTALSGKKERIKKDYYSGVESLGGFPNIPWYIVE